MKKVSKLIPNELLIIIYKMSDIETRVKLNKAFKWNFRVMNPYQDIDTHLVFNRKNSYKSRTQRIFFSIGGYMLSITR
jgi:transposase